MADVSRISLFGTGRRGNGGGIAVTRWGNVLLRYGDLTAVGASCALRQALFRTGGRDAFKDLCIFVRAIRDSFVAAYVAKGIVSVVVSVGDHGRLRLRGQNFVAYGAMGAFGKTRCRTGCFDGFIRHGRMIGDGHEAGCRKPSVCGGDGDDRRAGGFCSDDAALRYLDHGRIADGPLDLGVCRIFGRDRCREAVGSADMDLQSFLVENDAVDAHDLLKTRIPARVIGRRKRLQIRSAAVHIGVDRPHACEIVSHVGGLLPRLLVGHEGALVRAWMECRYVAARCGIGGVSPYLEETVGLHSARGLQRADVIAVAHDVSVVGNTRNALQISVSVGIGGREGAGNGTVVIAIGERSDHVIGFGAGKRAEDAARAGLIKGGGCMDVAVITALRDRSVLQDGKNTARAAVVVKSRFGDGNGARITATAHHALIMARGSNASRARLTCGAVRKHGAAVFQILERGGFVVITCDTAD